MNITKVAVIGSGVMGSGIAAKIANAGLPVVLLDIVPKGETADRSKIAKGAIEKMMKADEEYYRRLRDAPDKAREAEERLAELAVRFSDDPAYQAQLRLERAVRTGGDDAAG